MAGFSPYAAVALANYFFHRTALPTVPQQWYVALYIGDPESGGVEVTANVNTNYSRVLYSTESGKWTTPTGITGTVSNAELITFPAPGSQDWCASPNLISHYALCDAASAGNIWFIGALTSDVLIEGNDPAPRFNIGEGSVGFA